MHKQFRIVDVTLLAILFIILLGLVLTGCGDRFSRAHTGYTQVIFKQNQSDIKNLADEIGSPSGHTGLFSHTAQYMALSVSDEYVPLALAGGLVVFALNTSDPSRFGQKHFSDTGSASTTAWVIPNGKYYFSAIGYSAANMGGNPFCGRAIGDGGNAGDPVNLSGGTKVVKIAASNAKCNIAPFSPASYANLLVKTCAGALPSAGATTSDQCPGSGFSTTVNNIQVAIPSVENFSGGKIDPIDGAGALSKCVSKSGSSPYFQFVIPVLPVGVVGSETELRIGTQIRTFSNPSACEGQLNDYVFPGGFDFVGNSTVPFTTIIKDDIDSNTKGKWVTAGPDGTLFLN